METVVQCDFDGTITVEDVSYLLLDNFAEGNWRQILEDYTKGKMPVGTFNRKAFAMVKAGGSTLLDFVLKSDRVRIRPGFDELLNYCSRKGFKFVITSNGLSFYIEAILENIGIKGIEVFAAQSQFSPSGMDVRYLGPDGSQMEAGFKEAHTELLQGRGYSIVYVGNGLSDLYPARLASHVFATGDLLRRCRETKLECTPFSDLNDVVSGLEVLSLG
jgi:2-hydroxy-3-keto-5-methylthiopentenyl-1-phosphate phosphatase